MTNSSDAPVAGKNVLRFKRRRTPEEGLVDDSNERRRIAAALTWPEIPPPRDWGGQTDEELAELDFDGIPEFRSDGMGPGTPEFREQLEAYFHVVRIASRHAIAALGLSRCQLTGIAERDLAEPIVVLLREGMEYAQHLVRILEAAAVRQVVGIALRDMEAEAESGSTTTTAED
jgi:hypothetical protein